jgi:predicted transcriptional regulator
MATPRKRSSPKANIPRAVVEEAIAAVEDLPIKPKAELSAAEVIEMGRDQIVEALKEKNYTYEEVAEMLSKQGVEITASSLRYYLTRKKPAEVTSQRKTRRASTKSASNGRKTTARQTRTSQTATEPVEEMPEAESATTSEKSTGRSKAKGTGRTAAKRKTTTTRSKSPTTSKTTRGRGRSTSTSSRRGTRKASDKAAEE